MWWGGPYYGMGQWGWWMLAHGLLYVALFALMIAAIFALVRRSRPDRSDLPAANDGETAKRPSGLTILDERYAKGEIGRDEYLQKRKDLVS